jgi:hypothetical protein
MLPFLVLFPFQVRTRHPHFATISQTPQAAGTAASPIPLLPTSSSASRVFPRSIETHRTSTNITLLRFEDIPDPPPPHDTNCEEPYYNQAFGGKVMHTSCARFSPTFEEENSNLDSDLFTGTIDTFAVTLLQNLGSPTSQTSYGALNYAYTTWLQDALPDIVSLLIATAYAVSINPSLVQVSVEHDEVDALSGLQILLITLPFLLAILIWIGFRIGLTTGWRNPPLDRAWSRSVWRNVVQMTKHRGTEEGERLYVRKLPDAELADDEDGKGKYMRLDGEPLWLGPALAGLEALVEKGIRGDEDEEEGMEPEEGVEV